VELGMDVPFFLGSGRAVARGRGEQLTALPSGGGYALVLLNPRVPLSTREVYGRVPAGWRAEQALVARPPLPFVPARCVPMAHRRRTHPPVGQDRWPRDSMAPALPVGRVFGADSEPIAGRSADGGGSRLRLPP